MEKVFSIIVTKQFYISCLAFLGGVFLASFVSIPLSILLFMSFLGVCLFASAFVTPDEYIKKISIAISFFIIVFSLGAIRFELHGDSSPDQVFASKVGQQITLESEILGEPINKGSYTQYVVLAPNSNEKVLVRGENYPKFKYGDRVSFTGKLQAPTNFETEKGKEFDYVSHLRKDDIHYILSFARGTLVSEGNGNIITSMLLTLKQSFVRNVNTLFPEPSSSLMAGVLLGVQDSLGTELEEVFRDTGIIHIVVLSGYNITIVSESLVKLFSFLPKNLALGSGAFGIILFSLMVGATPSVLRASLMALLVLLARGTGRTYAIARALLIAAVVMVFWNPNILVFDTSFQLSFLATIALIWISPLVSPHLTAVPEKFGFREVVSATIATQVFVLPLLLYKMGQVSLVGLPVNVLVLWLIPTIMILGFIASMIEFAFHFLAVPVAYVTYLLLMYVIKTAEFFATLPFATVTVSYFPALFLWSVYGLYGYLYWRLKERGDVGTKS